MHFSIGLTENERITIEVESYERPASGQSHDDNWLDVEVSVSAGGFRGNTHASILTWELASFSEQLDILYDTLTGTAEFATLEGQLSLRLAGDGRGHIELAGSVMDRAGTGNTLSFTLHFDQTCLAQSMNELDAVIRAFPVRRK